jgi:hypothetical protein
MNLEALINESRKKARVHEADQSDLEVTEYLNQGILRFSEMVGGVAKIGSVPLQPRFWITTNHEISLQTDGFGPANVRLTDTNLERATGAEVAAAFQSQLRSVVSNPSASVIWDSEEFQFTIQIPGATSIVVDRPVGAYLDGTIYVGGQWIITGDTYTTAKYTGYYSEADLPADMQQIHTVKVNGKTLHPHDFYSLSARVSGTPSLYATQGNILRVSPSPRGFTGIEVQYSGTFTPFDTSEPLDTTQEPDVPHPSQSALAFFAASVMAENRFEYETSSRLLGQFQSRVSWYRINIGNDNTRIGFTPEGGRKTMFNEEVNI